MPQDHRVELDAFHGPLDLLLHLIRRHELDIQDIPIATVTEQYLAYLSEIDRVDIDTAGEFLVTAATLMEIKSRMVALETEGKSAAGVATTALDESDPRYELVHQLLAYRRYRAAAEDLTARKETWERQGPVAPIGVHSEELRRSFESLDDALDVDDLGLHDLVEAFARLAATVNFDRVGDHEVLADDTPIELHAADLVDRLSRERDGQMPLFAALEGRPRREVIGLLLAMLDLVRRGRITFEQAQSGGYEPISIRMLDGGDDDEDDGSADLERSGPAASENPNEHPAAARGDV